MDAARAFFARERRACVQARRRDGKTTLLVGQMIDDAIDNPRARMLYVAHTNKAKLKAQALFKREIDRRVCEEVDARVTWALPGAGRSGYDFVYLDEVSAAAPPGPAVVRAACTWTPSIRHQAGFAVLDVTVA